MSDFPTRTLRDKLRAVDDATTALRAEVTDWFGRELTPGCIAGAMQGLQDRLAFLRWSVDEAESHVATLAALADEDDQAAWDAWRATGSMEAAEVEWLESIEPEPDQEQAA